MTGLRISALRAEDLTGEKGEDRERAKKEGRRKEVDRLQTRGWQGGATGAGGIQNPSADLEAAEVLLLTSDSWIMDRSPPRKSDPALRAEVGSFPVPKDLFLGSRLEEQPASQSRGPPSY